jgi:hypothetical protein
MCSVEPSVEACDAHRTVTFSLLSFISHVLVYPKYVPVSRTFIFLRVLFSGAVIVAATLLPLPFILVYYRESPRLGFVLLEVLLLYGFALKVRINLLIKTITNKM